MIEGSCLCGEIHFEIKEIHGPFVHCHCSYCRKAHAAAFSSNGKVKTEDLTIIKGENFIQIYESSPGKDRIFCSKCGSHLWHRKVSDPDTITLKLGVIDKFDEFNSKDYHNYHINCDSDEPWMEYENSRKYPFAI